MAETTEKPGTRNHRAIGSWRQTVQFSGAPPPPPVRTIAAFTSDGIAHAALERTPDPGLGVWEPEDDNTFRLTSVVFRHTPSSDGFTLAAVVL